jgi:hypothetical protein
MPFINITNMNDKTRLGLAARPVHYCVKIIRGNINPRDFFVKDFQRGIKLVENEPTIRCQARVLAWPRKSTSKPKSLSVL